MNRMLAAVVGLTLVALPAWAEPAEPDPADVAKVLAETAVAPTPPITIGVTSWLTTTPQYNNNVILSFDAPLAASTWSVLGDYVPSLGTGQMSVACRRSFGNLSITPSLGYRFFGAKVDAPEGYQNGPQLQVGAAYPLLNWLSASASLSYAPWLLSMNKSGAGSYSDFTAALTANVGRVYINLGYTGMMIDANNAGFGAFRGAYQGGPILGVMLAL